jgi:hypothetical protein
MGNVIETFRDTLGLEITKRIAGTSIKLQKHVSGHCGGVGPLQNERRDSTQSRAINVRALTIPGMFLSPIGKSE